jgi:hypothetical protein
MMRSFRVMFAKLRVRPGSIFKLGRWVLTSKKSAFAGFTDATSNSGGAAPGCPTRDAPDTNMTRTAPATERVLTLASFLAQLSDIEKSPIHKTLAEPYFFPQKRVVGE